MSAAPAPPSPSSDSSKVSQHGATMLRNVITGVITTVIGAAALYFLKFNKPDDLDKQATNKAWNSLEFYENQFKETGTRLVCSGDTTYMVDNVISEYDKIIDNIGNIKKIEHVDDRLLSLIDRRIKTLEDKKEATKKYYSDIAALGPDATDAQGIDLYKKFFSKISALDTQDTAFINGVNSELKKKYKVDFKFMMPLEVTDEFLVGYWTYDRQKDIQLNKDNTFIWKSGDTDYKGTWFLSGLNIKFTFSADSSSISYNITNGNKNFILLQETSGAAHFLCRNN